MAIFVLMTTTTTMMTTRPITLPLAHVRRVTSDDLHQKNVRFSRLVSFMHFIRIGTVTHDFGIVYIVYNIYDFGR